VTCESGATSTLVFTVAAPGWTFDELGPSTFSEQVAFDSFGAIAPDTAAATVTVTSSAPCDVVLLGDELTGNDRTGGKTTFDAHVIASGNGDCVDQIQIGHDDDAVWSACWTAGNVIDLGGFDAGAYSTGDAAGYQITEAPASTVVATHFSTSSAMDRFVMTTVSIKPG
jgi:hypothetical protein